MADHTVTHPDPSGVVSNKGPEFDNQGQAQSRNCGTK